MSNQQQAVRQIAFIYAAAGALGLAVYLNMPSTSLITAFLQADLAMTLFVFACSLYYRNSSVYDAYWSVIPFYFAVALLAIYRGDLSWAQYAVAAVVSLWSWRLTLNWLRSWPGFDHEDWRYRDMAASSGKWYPLVNFFAIHLFPTLMVFGGMLPVFFVFSQELSSLGLLIAGLVVSLSGTALEFFADNTLAAFRRRADRPAGQVLSEGLWGKCRHPNYLGEMLFWGGLALAGQAFSAPWYASLGLAAMLLMFAFASIPMKEARMASRYKDFEAYKAATPMLIPRIGK
jgi:steroid 5-alpha reductase family enzyme